MSRYSHANFLDALFLHVCSSTLLWVDERSTEAETHRDNGFYIVVGLGYGAMRNSRHRRCVG